MSLYKGTTLISGAIPDMANQSLSNLNSAGTKVIDGQWTYSYLDIDTTTSIHTTKHNLGTTGTGALSYLPADCTTYKYEVFVVLNGVSTSANNAYGFAGSSYENNVITSGFWGRVACGASSRVASNSFTLPITNGEVWTTVTSTAFSTTFQVTLAGYRRIGSNS